MFDGPSKEPEVVKSETVFGSEDRFIAIIWQDKTVKKAGGKNGAKVEDVLKACAARLKDLNQGLPCSETEVAIGKIETAIGILDLRTKRRVKQEVEGTGNPHKS